MELEAPLVLTDVTVHMDRKTFHMLYSVLIKRLAYGYSLGELAFLLGQAPGALDNLFISVKAQKIIEDHLHVLAYIFNCPVQHFMFQPNKELPSDPDARDTDDVANLQIRCTETMGSILPGASTVHTAFEITLFGESELYRIIELFSAPCCTARGEAERKLVSSYLLKLILSGYLDMPREALEIYEKVQQVLGKGIRPQFLSQVLRLHLIGKVLPKLQKTRDEGVWMYEKIQGK